MNTFPEALRPALARLMEKASSDYAAVTSTDAWPLSAPASELADAEIVRQGLATLGYDSNIQTAISVWEYYSLDIGAGWSYGPQTAEDACMAIASLCKNIAKGQDYAGFSSSI